MCLCCCIETDLKLSKGAVDQVPSKSFPCFVDSDVKWSSIPKHTCAWVAPQAVDAGSTLTRRDLERELQHEGPSQLKVFESTNPQTWWCGRAFPFKILNKFWKSQNARHQQCHGKSLMHPRYS